MDFSQAMITNLWGNPHSENLPAKLSGNMVDDIRERALRFFGADPKHFDLVFVANATAGVKLVAEAFRDLGEKTPKGRFWYGYHSEVHNSVLGIRQLCDGQYRCFVNDEEVDGWLASQKRESSHNSTISELGLFAYPGQSNLSGRRLPKTWPGRIREQPAFRNTYTLFDAAALAMTSPLDSIFADPATAPDFTCLSLYKVFGFPDLGALIVRRASGHVLSLRKYFGGGTIAQVFPLNGDSRSVKKGPGIGSEDWSIHDSVEDGTLPFHSILALGLAMDTHTRLYGSMVISPTFPSISLLTPTLGRYIQPLHEVVFSTLERLAEVALSGRLPCRGDLCRCWHWLWRLLCSGCGVCVQCAAEGWQLRVMDGGGEDGERSRSLHSGWG